ncbi:LysR family transcriptional regulator [Aureimonas flava]|uniref:LysR family transcriptional regulator n=1 Tax=Aureimonas flava TaxID=2320271 RepID=A0A3A1WGI8_9HYPH|nr:LysR family transcriptional regulator [Aureimonas flava]RIX98708.1 LysR family transcriptional regulator [Aureimonas flava]
MDRFTETEVLVNVAEQGSITKAADAMGQSVSAVSRYLSSLEERLGVRLVNRTTRRFSMTEEGEIFYQHAKAILAEMQDAEALVMQGSSSPSGTLKITASTSFSLLHLMPIIPDFMRSHPKVAVEVTAHNRYYDIIESGVDLAVRTRRVEADSSITIRRLAETRRRLVASPEYVAEMGMPHTPDDLENHRLLVYMLADDPLKLHLKKGGSTFTAQIRPTMTSNEGQLLLSAALSGMGIIAQPSYIVEDALERGQLVRVLDDWDLPRLTINLAFPTRRHLPAKTRIFIEFLVEHFRRMDYERLWTN